MSKKSFLFVFQSLDPGGRNKISILQAKILKEFGYRSAIAARNGLLINELKNNNIRFIEFSKYFRSGNFIVKIFTYISTLLLVFNEAKKFDYTIVNSDRYTSIICFIVSKLLNRQFYSCAHGVFEGKKILKNWSWGTKILAVSEGTKKNLINRYNVDSYKIKVVKNSIPALESYSEQDLIEYKNELGLNNKSISCCIANFEPVKRHLELIKAWQIVKEKNKNVHLILVGKYGKLKNDIVDFININNLNNCITIISENQNIPKLIGISEFTILVSSREGLPTVILESFSLMKTVIATEVPGINEIVINNYNGILVPLNDIDILSKSILKLFRDEKLKKKLSINAFNTYKKEYSYENYKENILNFFIE